MKKLIAAVMLSACVPVAAFAGDVYIGVNAGKNQLDNSNYKSSTAFGVFGGYSYNEYISAEASYTNLGSAAIDTSGFVIAGISDVTGYQMGVSAVGSFPLTQDFSLMGKLGMGIVSLSAASTSSTNSSTNYGVGAQYNFSKEVGVRVNYDSFTTGGTAGTAGSTLISAGLVYKM